MKSYKVDNLGESKNMETSQVISERGTYITQPKGIANPVNNYFCSITLNIQ